MFVKSWAKSRKHVMDLLKEEPKMPTTNLRPLHKAALAKAEQIRRTRRHIETPCYILDQAELECGIQEFQDAFAQHFPTCSCFYAVKANHYDGILRTMVAHGLGLDVSSGRELALALKCHAKVILFSGPGKTDEELLLALKYSDRVTVNLDSLCELERLSSLAQSAKHGIRAGVRIHTPVQGAWQKFGIPLEELPAFWRKAQKQHGVCLEGIHFHLSWNRTPEKYVAVLRALGNTLRDGFTPAMRGQVRFIDIGGGYYPHAAEGTYPWTDYRPGMSPVGRILRLADGAFSATTLFRHSAYLSVSQPIGHFARDIAAAARRFIRPFVHCEYYTEPGRILCTRAMHVAVRVVDVKSPTVVITDGGINMLGWGCGESFYHPIVNLTHPAKKERECTVFGPLCTPHDLWGYRLFTGKLASGDLLLIPFQGAYRYSMAQEFIKPIPPVVRLP
ncbi:MAG: alanine racemase [Candidatus Peregrinibacteria bacterium]